MAGTSWFGGGADLTPYYLFEETRGNFTRTGAACATPRSEAGKGFGR